MSTAASRRQYQPKPWYAHLTIDLFVRVLSRSIFHPAITLIFYLCLASVHKHTKPLAYYTLYYTAFLAIIEICVWANHRITYGKPRNVVWTKEVVVITGGGGGLGRVLMEMLMRKGAKVAILDIRGPDQEAVDLMESGDLRWEQCDVANLGDVQKAVEKVTEEFGPPTILINNAATAVVGLPLLSSSLNPTPLSATEAARTVTINTISHFNTMTTILPKLQTSPSGGTIVTISSILSHLDPANLSDYVASKSAISSLHNCLEHEIRVHPDANVRKNLKTILVEPGQLDTQLFSDITSLPWYATFFNAVLDVKDLATAIVRMLESGDSGIIRMPFYTQLMPWYGISPCGLQVFARWFSGLDQAIGRSKREVVDDKSKRP